MAEERRALGGPGYGEVVERRSRFAAHAAPVPDAESLAAWLAAVRAAHPGARHCPHAWVAEDGSARTSDDGEPAGTGGRPCLAALRAAGVRGAAVAVARTFGGRLLGAANLGRAYGRAAAAAVEAAGVRVLAPWVRLRVEVAYGELGRAEGALAAAGAEEVGRAFGSRAVLEAWVPAEACAALAARLPAGAWQPLLSAWR